MQTIDQVVSPVTRPVKAVQFGTGVFLRGFVEPMLEAVNAAGWNGSVTLVKSTQRGSTDALKEQQGLYTVTLRGLVDGKPSVSHRPITVVSDVVAASGEYEAYAALAKEPALRFVLSNTTEAGIVEDATDTLDMCPPKSFPAKLTKFLYERAQHFDYAADKGLILMPCELIEDNGKTLKKIILSHANRWNLGEKFIAWVNTACAFADTLVDRIVTGYPQDDAALWAQYGYEDRCIVTAEPYGLWVIACDKDIESELPLVKAGMPVVYADDLEVYRTRKVRILNGAHTSFVPAAYLAGYDIVRDAVSDPDFAAFIGKTLSEEVIPTIDLPEEELNAFASEVLERFANPFIDHKLLAICLNSISKYKARILPTVLDNKETPQRLAFALAALLTLYKTKTDVVQDEEAALRFVLEHDVDAILANADLWGLDLHIVSGFADAVKLWMDKIAENGAKSCVKELGA